MKADLIADTGGLLRALARQSNGQPSWPNFERTLLEASLVIVPSLVLAEIDYFLRNRRPAMRKLIAELFDPLTTYEFEPVLPTDMVRALHIDAKFHKLQLGLVDSAIAAIAERREVYRVLTTDHRDFAPLRIGERYDKAITLVP